jgi:hypothetical protein
MPLYGELTYGDVSYGEELAGLSDFHSGIGHGDDLKIRLKSDSQGRWFPLLHTGHYYFSTDEYYMYSNVDYRYASGTIGHLPSGLSSLSWNHGGTMNIANGPIQFQGPFEYTSGGALISYGPTLQRVSGELRVLHGYPAIDALSSVVWRSLTTRLLVSYFPDETPEYEDRSFYVGTVNGIIVSAQNRNGEMHQVDHLEDLVFEEDYYLNYGRSTNLDPLSGFVLQKWITPGTIPTGATYYRITPVDSDGEGSSTVYKSVVIKDSDFKSVAIVWEQVTGALYYNIYRGTSPNEVYFVDNITPGGPGTVSFVDDNSTPPDTSQPYTTDTNYYKIYLRRDTAPTDVFISYLRLTSSLEINEVVEVSSDGAVRCQYDNIYWANTITASTSGYNPLVRKVSGSVIEDVRIYGGHGSVGVSGYILDTNNNPTTGVSVTKTNTIYLPSGTTITSGDFVGVRYYVKNSFTMLELLSDINNFNQFLTSSGDYRVVFDSGLFKYHDVGETYSSSDLSYVQLNPLENGVRSGFLWVSKGPATTPIIGEISVFASPRKILRGPKPSGTIENHYWSGNSPPSGHASGAAYKWTSLTTESAAASSYWNQVCRVAFSITDKDKNPIEKLPVTVSVDAASGELNYFIPPTSGELAISGGWTSEVVLETDWQGRGVAFFRPKTYATSGSKITVTVLTQDYTSGSIDLEVVSLRDLITEMSATTTGSEYEFKLAKLDLYFKSNTENSKTVVSQLLRMDGTPYLEVEPLKIKFVSNQVMSLTGIQGSSLSNDSGNYTAYVPTDSYGRTEVKASIGSWIYSEINAHGLTLRSRKQIVS